MEDPRWNMLADRLDQKINIAIFDDEKNILRLVKAWMKEVDRKTFTYRLANCVIGIDPKKVKEDWDNTKGSEFFYCMSEIYRAIGSRNLDTLLRWQRETPVDDMISKINTEISKSIRSDEEEEDE